MIQEIDAYIAALPTWQQEITKKLRETIHAADPTIQETIRWNSPAFTKQGLICWFWAFKKHVSIVFHNGATIPDTQHLFNAGLQNKKNRAIHFHEGDTIPAALVEYVRLAVEQNK